MKKLFFLLLFISFLPLLAQPEKKVSKAIETFNNGKMDKGIVLMDKIVNNYPSNNNYDILVEMYYQRYLAAYKTQEEVLAILMQAALEGKNVTVENNSTEYFIDFVNGCKKATLYSESPTASRYLRNFFVDYVPDTSVHEEAKGEYQQAEQLFIEKDYENAIIHYQNALQIQPDYYKATIYLGDSYYFQYKMDSAIHYFTKGIEMYPDLLEPRKYLVDALIYEKRTDEALKECYGAIYLYPDQGMFAKYGTLAKIKGKMFDKKWIPRGCAINAIGHSLNLTKDPVWSNYQKAYVEIKNYCDSNGVIIKPNSFTQSNYLEVYSWEKMLNESENLGEEFDFAKKMAEEGYLDCFVFLSVFHYDYYKQYLHFVENNKERIKEYMEKYLTEGQELKFELF